MRKFQKVSTSQIITKTVRRRLIEYDLKNFKPRKKSNFKIIIKKNFGSRKIGPVSDDSKSIV